MQIIGEKTYFYNNTNPPSSCPPIESSTVVNLKVPFSLYFSDKTGRKQYSREELLKLKDSPLCRKKPVFPENLPCIKCDESSSSGLSADKHLGLTWTSNYVLNGPPPPKNTQKKPKFPLQNLDSQIRELYAYQQLLLSAGSVESLPKF